MGKYIALKKIACMCTSATCRYCVKPWEVIQRTEEYDNRYFIIQSNKKTRESNSQDIVIDYNTINNPELFRKVEE